MSIDLGNVLKRRDMKPSQLADGIDVSRGYISEIMSGKKQPSMAVIDEICRFTGASRAELFADDTSASRGLHEPSSVFVIQTAPHAKAGSSGTKPGLQQVVASRSQLGFAILAGDILNIDPRLTKRDGGLFVVNRVGLQTGDAATLVRRAFPEALQSDDPAAPPEPWSSASHDYGVMGKIVGVKREMIA